MLDSSYCCRFEILDAGEREHEEMNDITAIWLLKRHKVTHV